MAMAVVSKDGFKMDHSLDQKTVWLGGRARELDNWTFVNGLPWNEVLGNQHQISNSKYGLNKRTEDCCFVFYYIYQSKCICPNA